MLLDLVSALVEVGLHGLDELVEGAAVGGLDVGDGDAGGGLPARDAAEAGLVLHDAVGHAHLAAKGGKEQHDLEKTKMISTRSREEHEVRLKGNFSEVVKRRLQGSFG